MTDDLIIKPKPSDKEEKKANEETVSKASPLASKVIYEIIRREGEEELARTNRSLVWSGLAAGLMMSFSVLGESIFHFFIFLSPLSSISLLFIFISLQPIDLHGC